MSSEAALLSLSATISGLRGQIDDLKQDKRDLRSDKESLKAEVADLKEQLRVASAEAARLKDDLQITNSRAEEWRKLCELATFAQTQKAPDVVSHQATSIQTTSNSGSTPIVAEFIPEASPLTQVPATPSPVTGVSPPSQIIEDDSTKPPSSRTRKRKAGAIGDSEDAGESRQKRSSGTARRNPRPQRQIPSPAAGGSQHAPTSIHPVVPYNEDVAFVLPPHILRHYIDLTPPLVISPAPSDLHVSREFLANIYGGSPKQSAQHVGAFENPTEDCHRAFTFPGFDLNPDMPLVPGHGGVIIASRYDRKTGHPWGLFRKDLTGKTQTWMYMGEYEWKAMGTMSAETFRCQKQKVKENWADELLGWKRGLGDYYPAIRARVALRKAGLLPAPNISDHERLVKEELERVRSEQGHPVDRDDIIAAFECGDEALDITLLQCVSYDWTLAMDIEEKFASPPARVKRTTKKKYHYPSEFQSFATRGHKKSSQGKREALPSLPAKSPSLSRAMPRATHDPSQASSLSGDDGLLLYQGMSGVYNIVVGEENLDDGLSYVSADEVDELSYP